MFDLPSSTTGASVAAALDMFPYCRMPGAAAPPPRTAEDCATSTFFRSSRVIFSTGLSSVLGIGLLGWRQYPLRLCRCGRLRLLGLGWRRRSPTSAVENALYDLLAGFERMLADLIQNLELGPDLVNGKFASCDKAEAKYRDKQKRPVHPLCPCRIAIFAAFVLNL